VKDEAGNEEEEEDVVENGKEKNLFVVHLRA
jgi:hypothetical protein